MKPRHWLNLLALSMIWGCSFIFFKIAAPEMQAPFLAWARVLTGALFLGLLYKATQQPTHVLQHWRVLVWIAAFAATLPFMLFAWASKSVSASVLVILNATAPIWSAIIQALLHRKAPKPLAVVGLLLGMAGVSLIVSRNLGNLNELVHSQAALGMLAALAAAACYGVATNMTLGMGKHLDHRSNALGCLVYATVQLSLLAPFTAPEQLPSAAAMWATLGVGVLCSGVAYLIYFKLADEIGPTSALTVTFLTPIFGILWSVLLLGESIGWETPVGGLVVLSGTYLVLKHSR